MSLFTFFVYVALFMLAKYFLVYGLSYWFFWILKPAWTQKFQIQVQPRTQPQVSLELKYSMISLLILTVVLTPLLYFSSWGQQVLGHTHPAWFNVYSGLGSQGWGREIIAFLIYTFYYDAYFYFSHRFLHTSWLYKKVHVIHHRSLNPTPLASYSFHPIEACINVLYLIPFLYFIPVSFPLFLILHLLSDFSNWNGHVGYDFAPAQALKIKAGLTTPTHHNLHHQYSKFNFGLYWNGWDYFFKTLHPQTENEFKRVKTQGRS